MNDSQYFDSICQLVESLFTRYGVCVTSPLIDSIDTMHDFPSIMNYRTTRWRYASTPFCEVLQRSVVFCVEHSTRWGVAIYSMLTTSIGDISD